MFKISDECCNRDKKQFCICVLVVFPKWAMVFYGFFLLRLDFTKSFVWKLHDIVIKTDNIS